VQKVRAGFDFTCAWLQSGDVRCWGYGENGRLGLGGIENLGDDELPSSVPPVDLGGGTVADLTVGAGHACVLFDDGAVTCWGVGVFGALGYASLDHIGDDELPDAVGPVDLGATATAAWAGSHNTCARLADTSIVCWGHGDLGANGYGSTDTIGDDETPAGLPPVSFGAELQQLTEGQGEHFCGVSDDGLVCWGFNGWGQLGLGRTGNVGDDELPSDVGLVPL
jgi:alpha-tubulin suppressor-like RCC1 family protein